MNRRVVINSVIGGAFGMSLAAAGHYWYTPEFWILFGLLVAAIINTGIPSRHE